MTNKIFQNNWETVFNTENMPFSVAGIILPDEALNPDLLRLLKKIHNNSTHAQLLSNRM